MININNLSLSYGNTKVLSSINLKLPSKGLFALLGPSGCGKTSLFNCLSGLVKYEGEINIDGVSINNLSDKEMHNYRLNNIGFIFQDFKIFNLDTVSHNVAFPFDVLNGYSSTRNERRIKDLIRLVGLDDKEKEPVKNLSGGEKQRVAIARALINNPSLLLADEPTGALDEENANKIMALLRDISKERLVIVVSHDEELISKYVDTIIYLKDGKIIQIKNTKIEKEKKSILLINSEHRKRKPSIPFSFLFRHTFSNIKERKWRTLLINIVTSLGLIGVGLATSLSTSISVNIKKACSSLMSENQIMFSSKEKNEMLTLNGKSYEEAERIKEYYPEYIDDIGAIYQTDFNRHFEDQNEFNVKVTDGYLRLPGYSAKYINEFKWLDKEERDYYPYKPDTLDNDEIVLALSLSMVNDICLHLQLPRNVLELGNYIKNHNLHIIFSAKNMGWQYSDQQIFTIRAFTLDYDLAFYHYNHRWNEYIFENQMRFPFTNNISLNLTLPWTLKKLHFIEVKEETQKELFLSKIRNDERMDSYLFEVGNYQYFPITYKYEEEVKGISRLLILENNLKGINYRLVDKIESNIKGLYSPILGSNGGYAIYQEAMMMGFSSYTYFSFDKSFLEETLLRFSSVQTLNNQSVSLPENILLGHYSKSMQNGVIFKQIPDIYQKDINITSLDEIVVSSKFASLFSTKAKDVLSIAFTINEQKLPNGKMVRDFKTVDVRVKAIIPSEEIAIYHQADWPILFYQCRVGTSVFSLGINTIAFSVSKDVDFDRTLSLAKRAFPSYKVSNPMSSLNESIDEVCFYLEFVMYIFSLIAVVISIFLLSICNYLHILEIQCDIGLSRCIGVSKGESTKFIFTHAYIMAFIAFLVASVELIVLNYFISKIISSFLEVGFSFSLNPLSLIYMFLLAFVIATISSILISFKVIRFSPLDALKVM